MLNKEPEERFTSDKIVNNLLTLSNTFLCKHNIIENIDNSISSNSTDDDMDIDSDESEERLL